MILGVPAAVVVFASSNRLGSLLVSVICRLPAGAAVPIVPAVLQQRLPAAWRTGFEGHALYLGLTESFAEALRAWKLGTQPDHRR